jgi:hypothetical protein
LSNSAESRFAFDECCFAFARSEIRIPERIEPIIAAEISEEAKRLLFLGRWFIKLKQCDRSLLVRIFSVLARQRNSMLRQTVSKQRAEIPEMINW